ncbi:hypothetical protein HFN63_36945 [Rhizobium leguminosarum]|uniref:hypothetical protein n=1 Tax=Rhizobium leguminosarum TaxID=384 RepID=UPI001C973786|nr:hypothetical protein [Rhizobium leguminosarum]MBY5775494.1 hypothetical protein [Rhizobium leguminosarum]
MAKFEKKPVNLRDRFDRALEAQRKDDLDSRIRKAQLRAEKIADRLKRQSKLDRYEKDMKDRLDKADKEDRGEVGFKPFGNKKLKIEKEGELTRTRGRKRFRKTRKILKRGPDKEVYVGRFEKESWRKTTSYDSDANGVTAISNVYNEGGIRDGRRFDQQIISEDGQLIGKKYYTNRFRDVGIRSAISEEIGDTFERDGKKYRILTHQQGRRKEIYELEVKPAVENPAGMGGNLDEAHHLAAIGIARVQPLPGNLKLIDFRSRWTSRDVKKSVDGKTSQTEIKPHGIFASVRESISYQTRLGPNGEEIGVDITKIGRGWNKRSRTFDDVTGKLTSEKHTLGKLYNSETVPIGATHNYTSRRILGLRLLPGSFKPLNTKEREDAELRVKEVAQQNDAWKEVVHQVPPPGSTRQLGSSAKDSGNSVAPVAPEDEEEAFLRSLGPQSANKHSSAEVNSTDPNTKPPLDSRTPVGNGEGERTKPASHQSSVASISSASTVGLQKKESLNSLPPESASIPHTTFSKDVDPDTADLLANWEPIDEVKGDLTPSNCESTATVSKIASNHTKGKDAASRRGYDEKSQAISV